MLTIVVVGASGDLAKRKIFPALYLLFEKEYVDRNRLPFQIIAK